MFSLPQILINLADFFVAKILMMILIIIHTKKIVNETDMNESLLRMYDDSYH